MRHIDPRGTWATLSADIAGMVLGGVGTFGGLGMMGGGVALDATGAGAIVGVPVTAEGIAVAGHGFIMAGHSLDSLTKDLPALFKQQPGASEGGLASENQVINNIRNKVPNEELTPPTSRGNAPLSNKDGRPVEIHHNEQSPTGPFDEMHPSDHRYGKNYQKNHPDYNQPSKIDRTQFRKDKRGYWENEWDNGRWDK